MGKTQVTGALLLAILLVFGACAPTPAPPPTPSPASTPSLTSAQAMGLVAASLRAAASPVVRDSAGYFKAEFNYSSRQWAVTVWKAKEDSEKYLGDVYIVDDATGKVLNPPPAYNPKSSQLTQPSKSTLTAPIVPSAPTVPPATEAPLALTGSRTIEGFIDGEFQGWDGETIFRLTNGQIWQQAEYSYLYHYAYMPRVTIFSVSGGYNMQVEGVNKAIRVQQLTDAPLALTGSQAIESFIDGKFQGWDGETIFRLTNGQVWQQAEYSYLYHYAYMPRVTIFSVSGGYKMQVEGINKTIRVQRLR